MRYRVFLLAALAGAGLVLATSAQAQTTERVSFAFGTDDIPPNSHSESAAISADGRFVAFSSRASDLVPGDSAGTWDVFVHDRVTGLTELGSVASDGTQGNESSSAAAISADGRFVAFRSFADNLVLGDTNGRDDIFVHDRVTGITELVSVASDGAQGNSSSFNSVVINAGGRFVAFDSEAPNLVADDTNIDFDIFVHDRDTGVTERVSVASDGTEGNDSSLSPAISADGRFVAFYSEATNLVPGDTNGQRDVFVRDRDTGITERVSVASDGTEANSFSLFAAISADGRFVAFWSTASNLVAGDTNSARDVFVHDRDTGTTERVSVANDGAQGNGDSRLPAISFDGRFVAFDSVASNLVAGDSNGTWDVFVHDRVTGTTERVSVASDGTEARDFSGSPAISADGRFVAFESDANNLAPGGSNGWRNIFVRDRGLPPQLSMAGACPGSVSLRLENATPDGLVAFGWGTSEGSVTLPPGPCAGTELGLADPTPLIVLSADPDGSIALNENLNAGVCGLLLQAIDVATCAPSNVASVP